MCIRDRCKARPVVHGYLERLMHVEGIPPSVGCLATDEGGCIAYSTRPVSCRRIGRCVVEVEWVCQGANQSSAGGSLTRENFEVLGFDESRTPRCVHTWAYTIVACFQFGRLASPCGLLLLPPAQMLRATHRHICLEVRSSICGRGSVRSVTLDRGWLSARSRCEAILCGSVAQKQSKNMACSTLWHRRFITRAEERIILPEPGSSLRRDRRDHHVYSEQWTPTGRTCARLAGIVLVV